MAMNHAARGLITLIVLASASGRCLAAAKPPTEGFVPADVEEALQKSKTDARKLKADSSLQKKESESAAQKDAVMVEGLASVVLGGGSYALRIAKLENLKALYERTNEEGLQLRIVAILLTESPKTLSFFAVPREGIRISPVLYAKALTASVQKTILQDLQKLAEHRPYSTHAVNAIDEITKLN